MNKNRIGLGLLLIFAGVSLILNKLGYFGQVNVFSLLVSISLLVSAIKRLFARDFYSSMFIFALVALINDDYLGIQAISPWTLFLSSSLLGTGLSFIFSKGPRFSYRNKRDFKGSYRMDLDGGKFIEEENGVFKMDFNFTGGIKYIVSDDFKSASVRSNFSGIKLYFNDTNIKGPFADLYIDSKFSGLEIYVPRDWDVKIDIGSPFSGIEEKGRPSGLNTKELRIYGDAPFSGIEICYM